MTQEMLVVPDTKVLVLHMYILETGFPFIMIFVTLHPSSSAFGAISYGTLKLTKSIDYVNDLPPSTLQARVLRLRSCPKQKLGEGSVSLEFPAPL
jgi:hypothetical protein